MRISTPKGSNVNVCKAFSVEIVVRRRTGCGALIVTRMVRARGHPEGQHENGRAIHRRATCVYDTQRIPHGRLIENE
jgi:hypothetical protein